MIKVVKAFAVTVLIGAGMIYNPAQFVLAQEPSVTQSADTDTREKNFVLSPAQYVFKLFPGAEQNFSGQISNNTAQAVNVLVEFKNIDTEKFLRENKLVSLDNPGNPAAWLFADQVKFDLPANSTKVLNYRLQIPQNSSEKGFYPAVIYNISNLSAQGFNVNVDATIVSLLYLDVNNNNKAVLAESNTQKSLEISGFSPAANIVFSPRAQFSLSYRNTGNTFVQPRGIVKIYDRSGKLLSNFPTVNDSYIFLLQGQEKLENLAWNPANEFKLIPDFGQYTAVTEIYQDADQKILLTARTNFLVLPLGHLLAIILLLGSIIVFIRKKRAGK